MCTRSARGRGFTLLELVLLVGVLAIALAGMLVVYQTIVRASADPQVQKQALAVAEALLDEVLLSSYDPRPGGGPPRAGFNDVDDYDGYSTGGGIEDINGNPVAGLSGYNIAGVSVAIAPLNGVAEAKRITVIVSGPDGYTMALDGWRLRYEAP